MVCIWQGFHDAAGGYLSAPQGLFYSVPYRTLPDPALPEDWARVTGIWLGTYAFLDYSRLLAFNGGPAYAEGGHSLDLRDEEEVCGDLLRMELALDNSVREDPVLKSNVPISRDLPPLYFTGTSQGSEYPSHPTTTIKGFAALAIGGREVKWKLIVEYHGVDQWQLEGIQPGGVRSGGIFGGEFHDHVLRHSGTGLELTSNSLEQCRTRAKLAGWAFLLLSTRAMQVDIGGPGWFVSHKGRVQG